MAGVVGAGGGRLGAGRRLLQLDLQATGAASQAGPASAAAAAATAAQRHLPNVQVRASLLGVLLPERRSVLHGGDLRQPHLQLRVSRRLRGAALRVQGPRPLVRADEPPTDDGDGVHRRRRDGGRVPGDASLRGRVGEAAAERQGGVGRGRARQRGGRGASAPPAASSLLARLTLVLWHGPLFKNLCDNYFTKLIIYFKGICFVYTGLLSYGVS